MDTNLLYGSVTTIRGGGGGSRGQFEAMNQAISVARMRPVIDRAFPFKEVPAALRYFEAMQPFGKVVISHA